MNKARREYCQLKVSEGMKPKAAYNEAKTLKPLLNSTVWRGGALFKNPLKKK